ncbi:MAG: HxsD-like protein [Candidatus Thorarchaeota archaeon]
MEKVKINKAKNKVLVNFNEQFYKREFVDKAILDFKEVCDIKKSKEGLLLRPKEKLNIDILGYEFYNYVLSLMKNQ